MIITYVLDFAVRQERSSSSAISQSSKIPCAIQKFDYGTSITYLVETLMQKLPVPPKEPLPMLLSLHLLTQNDVTVHAFLFMGTVKRLVGVSLVNRGVVEAR
ncbi:hypothetical protein TNCV_248121 [Trichonephila clavipes]|nr:hypothetical protein TNCV_248121 [Trichonephila clavipes]